MGAKWMQLDEAEISAIPHIELGEYCYYFLTRVSGGFSASTGNNRIDNFKKPLDKFADRPDVLRHKWREVDAFASDLSALLTDTLSGVASQFDVALVPVNTSRPWEDDFHDPRLILLCERAAARSNGVRVANVMQSKRVVWSSHTGGPRDLDSARENLQFLGFGDQIPDVAILVDDVLVTGSHYAVCRDAIRQAYPNVLVMGAFLCLHRSDYVDYRSFGIEYRG